MHYFSISEFILSSFIILLLLISSKVNSFSFKKLTPLSLLLGDSLRLDIILLQLVFLFVDDILLYTYSLETGLITLTERRGIPLYFLDLVLRSLIIFSDIIVFKFSFSFSLPLFYFFNNFLFT